MERKRLSWPKQTSEVWPWFCSPCNNPRQWACHPRSPRQHADCPQKSGRMSPYWCVPWDFSYIELCFWVCRCPSPSLPSLAPFSAPRGIFPPDLWALSAKPPFQRLLSASFPHRSTIRNGLQFRKEACWSHGKPYIEKTLHEIWLLYRCHLHVRRCG